MSIDLGIFSFKPIYKNSNRVLPKGIAENTITKESGIISFTHTWYIPKLIMPLLVALGIALKVETKLGKKTVYLSKGSTLNWLKNNSEEQDIQNNMIADVFRNAVEKKVAKSPETLQLEQHRPIVAFKALQDCFKGGMKDFIFTYKDGSKVRIFKVSLQGTSKDSIHLQELDSMGKNIDRYVYFTLEKEKISFETSKGFLQPWSGYDTFLLTAASSSNLKIENIQSLEKSNLDNNENALPSIEACPQMLQDHFKQYKDDRISFNFNRISFSFWHDRDKSIVGKVMFPTDHTEELNIGVFIWPDWNNQDNADLGALKDLSPILKGALQRAAAETKNPYRIHVKNKLDEFRVHFEDLAIPVVPPSKKMAARDETMKNTITLLEPWLNDSNHLIDKLPKKTQEALKDTRFISDSTTIHTKTSLIPKFGVVSQPVQIKYDAHYECVNPTPSTIFYIEHAAAMNIGESTYLEDEDFKRYYTDGHKKTLKEDIYLDDMEHLFHNIMFSQTSRIITDPTKESKKIDDVIWFPIGMGAFLRNIGKIDSSYNIFANNLALRTKIAERMMKVFEKTLSNPENKDLQIHLCLPVIGQESEMNFNAFVAAMNEAISSNHQLYTHLICHVNEDMAELGQKLADEGKNVSVLNGVNQNQIYNKAYQGGCLYASDEGYGRRLAPEVGMVAATILNGGTNIDPETNQFESRNSSKYVARKENQRIEATVKEFGGQIIKAPKFTST